MRNIFYFIGIISSTAFEMKVDTISLPAARKYYKTWSDESIANDDYERYKTLKRSIYISNFEDESIGCICVKQDEALQALSIVHRIANPQTLEILTLDANDRASGTMLLMCVFMICDSVSLNDNLDDRWKIASKYFKS